MGFRADAGSGCRDLARPGNNARESKRHARRRRPEMSEKNSFQSKQEAKKADRRFPDWYAALKTFRTPSAIAAGWQLVNTLLPYGCLWLLMIRAVREGYPYWMTLLLAFVASLFLVRLFILFHDCVHGSLFPLQGVNTFVGHVLGILVFTPFDDWRFSHLKHHASYADLDARGFGDIWTMTRTEYENASKTNRIAYRLYRHPLILLGLGAIFSFLLRFRLPARGSKRKARASVLFTNLIIIAVVMVAAHTIGLRTYILIQLPVVWFAGMMGIWLFYVQHQFECVYWARRRDWDALRAAMEGSSFYALPAGLRWFSANIGYHHVHHLNSRIPNYRLKRCCDSVPVLREKPALTIRRSLSAIHLKLWDEERKIMIGFP
jgi:omega-6 fatty acid desaturase (delta-12 desaturase)